MIGMKWLTAEQSHVCSPWLTCPIHPSLVDKSDVLGHRNRPKTDMLHDMLRVDQKNALFRDAVSSLGGYRAGHVG